MEVFADREDSFYITISWQEICGMTGIVFKERSTGVLVASCCFHWEITPSMHMWPSSGNFCCHGCGAKGSKFQFLKRFYEIPTTEEAKNKFKHLILGDDKYYPPPKDHPEFNFDPPV